MANITGVIRQKAEVLFFSSACFESWFHQNLSLAYCFSCNGGKGIFALVFTSIHWFEDLINWHDSRENCNLMKSFNCQYNCRLVCIHFMTH